MYRIALNSFAQPSGISFLAQGMHHHSELDMWPLIRANALYLDPVLYSLCAVSGASQEA